MEQATAEIEKLNQLLQEERTNGDSLRQKVASLEEKETILATLVSQLESKLTASETESESKDSKFMSQIEELRVQISTVI